MKKFPTALAVPRISFRLWLKMAPLHKINPLRLAYIRDAACRKFDRNARSLSCLSGLRILDIGCGAGRSSSAS